MGREGLAPPSRRVLEKHWFMAKRQKPKEHDGDVLLGIAQSGGDLLRRRGLLVQIQLEQLLPKEKKDQDAQGAHHHAEHQPEAQGVTHPLVIFLAGELRPKEGGAAQPAENGQVEDEDDLVDNGHAGHGGCAQTPHHHVVQKVDKLGDALLDDHGHQQGQHRGVEGPAANQLFP